jgi:hypothetical protein
MERPMDAQVTDFPNKRPRGRQRGSHVAPGLRRTSSLRPRDLVPLDRTSGAARFFAKMVREIEVDLGAGSRRNLSRIETELINAFCGAATQLRYLSHQILLGEAGEIDLAGFSQLASTMLRIGSRLGTTSCAVPVVGLHDAGGLLEQLHAEQTIEPGSGDGD